MAKESTRCAEEYVRSEKYSVPRGLTPQKAVRIPDT